MHNFCDATQRGATRNDGAAVKSDRASRAAGKPRVGGQNVFAFALQPVPHLRGVGPHAPTVLAA